MCYAPLGRASLSASHRVVTLLLRCLKRLPEPTSSSSFPRPLAPRWFSASRPHLRPPLAFLFSITNPSPFSAVCCLHTASNQIQHDERVKMNFTVEAPEGTTKHGDLHLTCTPPTWRTYITFFALKSLVHAATILTVPGKTKREIIFAVLNPVFVPGFSVIRALQRLFLQPGLHRKRPLESAVAAGALCIVASLQHVEEWSAGPDNWAAATFKRNIKDHLGHLPWCCLLLPKRANLWGEQQLRCFRSR